ncbi:MAG: hypothetical protein RR531_03290, partial [Longicatena sp.]
ETKRAGEIHPAADNNWRLAPIHSETKLDIRFETSPSDKAAAFIKEKGKSLVSPVIFTSGEKVEVQKANQKVRAKETGILNI